MPKLPSLQFVRTGVTQGLSANASYREYRAALRQLSAETGDRWTGQRRQDFLRLYSQTRALRGNAARAIQQPKQRLPTESEIVDRDTVRARGFGQWVAIFQRTHGEADFLAMPFLIKTQQPITPEEAEQRALDYLNQEPDNYNRVTLGVVYTGTERFNPQ